MPQSFLGLSGKQAKRSLETDAAAGSTSLELQTPWPQGLRANLFSQKNFDVISKTWSLWTLGEIKRPNTNCLKRRVCFKQQELRQDWSRPNSKLESSRLMGTHYIVDSGLSFAIFHVIPIEFLNTFMHKLFVLLALHKAHLTWEDN